MGVAMAIFLAAVGLAIAAGLVAVAINRLAPKRGNWLPVLVTTFVPPLIYVAFSIYRALTNLGMSAGPDGMAAPGSIGLFITAVQGYVFFTVIWLFVAVPASFAGLHLARRK
jgi:hypothetical protein